MASAYEVSANCIRVLKPPGGGSSDIFGTLECSARPRVARQQMQSSLFGPSSAQQNGAGAGGGSRTKSASVAQDSHNRLFGADPRALATPLKNHMRSNIGFGNRDSIDAALNNDCVTIAAPASSNASDDSSTNGDVSRYAESNGVSTNGASNGNSGKRVPPGGYSSGLW